MSTFNVPSKRLAELGLTRKLWVFEITHNETRILAEKCVEISALVIIVDFQNNRVTSFTVFRLSTRLRLKSIKHF